jgi:tRNA(Ile)-lysidine synthase
VEIREAGTTFRLTQQPVAPWMRHGSPVRAALDLPLAAGEPVTVRSRRPGDRLQPFGSSHHRRLKDLLIDRKVPRVVRQRLPLLCVGGQVAWVPGITIHHPFRLREGATMAWVAELLPRADDRNGIRR